MRGVGCGEVALYCSSLERDPSKETQMRRENGKDNEAEFKSKKNERRSGPDSVACWVNIEQFARHSVRMEH